MQPKIPPQPNSGTLVFKGHNNRGHPEFSGLIEVEGQMMMFTAWLRDGRPNQYLVVWCKKYDPLPMLPKKRKPRKNTKSYRLNHI